MTIVGTFIMAVFVFLTGFISGGWAMLSWINRTER